MLGPSRSVLCQIVEAQLIQHSLYTSVSFSQFRHLSIPLFSKLPLTVSSLRVFCLSQIFITVKKTPHKKVITSFISLQLVNKLFWFEGMKFWWLYFEHSGGVGAPNTFEQWEMFSSLTTSPKRISCIWRALQEHMSIHSVNIYKTYQAQFWASHKLPDV